MRPAQKMATGGMLAAVALVIMCLGGLIPVATFVCPVLCMVLLHFVSALCGLRIGWAWYVCVSFLSVLIAPDKEAAAVFAFLGYYPLLKPVFEKWPAALIWKLCLFNIAIFCMYTVLIYIFGMAYIANEYQEMGMVMLGILLVLGNFTFLLLDRLLTKINNKKSSGI